MDDFPHPAKQNTYSPQTTLDRSRNVISTDNLINPPLHNSVGNITSNEPTVSQRRPTLATNSKRGGTSHSLERLRLDIQEAQEEKAALMSQATVLSRVNVYLDEAIATLSNTSSKVAESARYIFPNIPKFAYMTPNEVVNYLSNTELFKSETLLRQRVRIATSQAVLENADGLHQKMSEFVHKWNDDPSSRQLVEQKLGACLKFRCKVARLMLEERPDLIEAILLHNDENNVFYTPAVITNLEISPKQMAILQTAYQEYKSKQTIWKEHGTLATQALAESINKTMEASSMNDQFSAHITALDAASMLEAHQKHHVAGCIRLYIVLNETLTPVQMGKLLLANNMRKLGPQGLICFHEAALLDSFALNRMDASDDGHLLCRSVGPEVVTSDDAGECS